MTPYALKQLRRKEKTEHDAQFWDWAYLQRVPLGLMGFPSRPPLSRGIRQSDLYKSIQNEFVEFVYDKVMSKLEATL